jgi:hypothetical protein
MSPLKAELAITFRGDKAEDFPHAVQPEPKNLFSIPNGPGTPWP